jgi:hypothetical protein
VTVIHVALLTAVHAQPAPAVTPTVPVPAAEELKFADTGEIDNEQGRPACVTVNVCPPIVSVPVRAAPTFAVTP